MNTAQREIPSNVLLRRIHRSGFAQRIGYLLGVGAVALLTVACSSSEPNLTRSDAIPESQARLERYQDAQFRERIDEVLTREHRGTAAHRAASARKNAGQQPLRVEALPMPASAPREGSRVEVVGEIIAITPDGTETQQVLVFDGTRRYQILNPELRADLATRHGARVQMSGEVREVVQDRVLIQLDGVRVIG